MNERDIGVHVLFVVWDLGVTSLNLNGLPQEEAWSPYGNQRNEMLGLREDPHGMFISLNFKIWSEVERGNPFLHYGKDLCEFSDRQHKSHG